MELTDKELVEKYQKGSPDALTDLLLRYHLIISKHTRYYNNSEEYHDRYADLRLIFIELCYEYDGRIDFAGYMGKKFPFRVLNYYKKQFSEIGLSELISVEQDTNQNPYNTEVLFSYLPNNLSTIARRYFLNGENQESIAKSLNVDQSVISRKLRSIREILKQYLIMLDFKRKRKAKKFSNKNFNKFES